MRRLAVVNRPAVAPLPNPPVPLPNLLVVVSPVVVVRLLVVVVVVCSAKFKICCPACLPFAIVQSVAMLNLPVVASRPAVANLLVGSSRDD